jgi:hypothetical protein
MALNRRKFFKWLGAGTAAAVVAPSVVKAMESLCVAPKPLAYSTYIMGKDAFIGKYIDYINFSCSAISLTTDYVVYV